MSTLETSLGSSQELEENAIVYVQVEKAAKAVITANFAANVRHGYVVAKASSNIIQLILETLGREERGAAELYVLELGEHNEREKRRLEEYELEQQIKEEEAKKSPLELVLDGFVRSGLPVRPMLSTYREKGLLFEAQRERLLKLLQIRRADDDFLTDLREIVEGRQMLDEERTWKTLVEQWNVRMPQPDTEPPNVETKSVPPILEELEGVVRAAYGGQGIEGLALSHSAWQEIGINPSSIYQKVRESVVPLNTQAVLVKVTGKGKSGGSVELLTLDKKKSGLRNGTPQHLRSRLRLPTELVDDFYRLSIVMAQSYASELERRYPETTKLERNNGLGMATIISERLLHGNAKVAASLYPDVNVRRLDEFREKFGHIAEAITSSIEGGEESFNYDLGNARRIQAAELREVVNYLASLLPEKLYFLRQAQTVMHTANKEIKNFEKARERGMPFSSGASRTLEVTRNRFEASMSSHKELSVSLSYLAEGANKWPDKMPIELNVRTLEFYGLV